MINLIHRKNIPINNERHEVLRNCVVNEVLLVSTFKKSGEKAFSNFVEAMGFSKLKFVCLFV